MKTLFFFLHWIAFFSLALAFSGCTEEPIGEVALSASAAPRQHLAPSFVQGYLHPFYCDMWLQFDGEERSWWTCPGGPDLQLQADLETGVLYFRSPRPIHLTQLWEATGFCPQRVESATLSREYNYWVLAVELSSGFFACLRERQLGFYFRLELDS